MSNVWLFFQSITIAVAVVESETNICFDWKAICSPFDLNFDALFRRIDAIYQQIFTFALKSKSFNWFPNLTSNSECYRSLAQHLLIFTLEALDCKLWLLVSSHLAMNQSPNFSWHFNSYLSFEFSLINLIWVFLSTILVLSSLILSKCDPNPIERIGALMWTRIQGGLLYCSNLLGICFYRSQQIMVIESIDCSYLVGTVELPLVREGQHPAVSNVILPDVVRYHSITFSLSSMSSEVYQWIEVSKPLPIDFAVNFNQLINERNDQQRQWYSHLVGTLWYIGFSGGFKSATKR